jgi:UDP-N-acetylglucosamine diphosphorylase/glucosamine-1-phosphate N-acetyltransferase
LENNTTQSHKKVNIILFDDDNWQNLLPLTCTRPVSELRIGILTIKEKWEKSLDGQASYITQDYLSEKYTLNIEEENYLINSSFLPHPTLMKYIHSLHIDESLYLGDELLCAKIPGKKIKELATDSGILSTLKNVDLSLEKNIVITRVSRPYHIFQYNDAELHSDFEWVTKEKIFSPLSPSNTVIGNSQNIFLEEGAQVEGSFLNAQNGPIYIGKNAEVMEGSMIRGPFAACEGSTVKMGAKIYGATTLGPYCKAGGEIQNSVFLAYSSKAHDGYLGNSVIGEWCNLGADTNNSNLKNNYLPVRLWSYTTQKFEDTGLQFCGLIMGDHSKCGINTMFNTGTVVGVASNIFGSGFPRNYIPSFSWGGASGFTTHKLDKVLETAQIVMERRQKTLTPEDISILTHIYQQTVHSK